MGSTGNYTSATAHSFPLSELEVASFDCYGTLVDWEGGFTSAVAPLLARHLPPDHEYVVSPQKAMMRLNDIGEALEAAEPGLRYDRLVGKCYINLVKELGLYHNTLDSAARAVFEGEAQQFGQSPGDHPPFADTTTALLKLKDMGVKLVILSNVDEDNIARTVEKLSPADDGNDKGKKGIFDAILTAEAIGSYKPDVKNFAYAIEHIASNMFPGGGVANGARDGEQGCKYKHIHVARSLTVDHVPCKEIGLPSVWITRGGDTKEGQGVGGDLEELTKVDKLRFGWKFNTLEEFVDAVARAKEKVEERKIKS